MKPEIQGRSVTVNNTIGSVLFFLMWMCGVVIAKGFWSTLAAICFFPWAIYLFAELLLNTFVLGA